MSEQCGSNPLPCIYRAGCNNAENCKRAGHCTSATADVMDWAEGKPMPVEQVPSEQRAKPWHRNVPARVSEYLENGGLFNPELMDHEAVRHILIDARDVIEIVQRERESMKCQSK